MKMSYFARVGQSQLNELTKLDRSGRRMQLPNILNYVSFYFIYLFAYLINKININNLADIV